MKDFKEILSKFYNGQLNDYNGKIFNSINQYGEPIKVQVFSDYLKITSKSKSYNCYDDGTIEEIGE